MLHVKLVEMTLIAAMVLHVVQQSAEKSTEIPFEIVFKWVF
jgi:hypothetical protein